MNDDNIKFLVDTIIYEADVRASEYTVLRRLFDINAEVRFLQEKAAQLGSKFPLVEGVKIETFTLVDGDNTFARTIKFSSPIKVEYRFDENDDWRCLNRKTECNTGCGFSLNRMIFEADEKEITIFEADPGELRVTYEKGMVKSYDNDDYVAEVVIDWLDPLFIPMLWLQAAKRQARFFKKDRVKAFQDEYDRLLQLFINKYSRNTDAIIGFVDGETENNYR